MSNRPIRVCLIQHSTRSDNLGVGALTVSEVEILREIGREIGREIEITIADWKGARPVYVTGPDIRIVDIDRKIMLSPRGYFAMARHADLVIDIGAGDSFADIYGPGRLRRMFWLKALTHLAGTPLVMAPQTIGPFTKPWSRRLARWSMRRSVLVASRDRLSTEAGRRLGIDKVIEASDVALRLPWTPPPPREPGEGPIRVGINVSGLLMEKSQAAKEDAIRLQVDYPSVIRELIRYFQSHPDGCEVHLVPHVFPARPPEGGPAGEDDYQHSETLAAELPPVVLAPRFASPAEAKSYIAGLDFFMGGRMHACIAALSAGVPVVPMAYSRKFEGLFGTIDYPHTVDCTASTTEAIVADIKTKFGQRAELEKDRGAAFEEGKRKLRHYQDALREVLRGVGA